MKSLPHNNACPRGSARSADVCLRRCSISSSCPRVGSLQPLSRPCPCAGSSATGFHHASKLLHFCLAPFNLHRARVRRLSGFLLTAVSNATPHAFLQPQALILRRVRKSTSVTRQRRSGLASDSARLVAPFPCRRP